MDATNQRFAYRCLPLNIANAYGWEVLCNAGFLAMWWGGEGLDSIVIEPDPGTIAPAISHFGHGILTFHLPCLFSTEPGAELMVQGPINRPKDGIAALSGVIETDWSPYSFTMNWMFTRPGTPALKRQHDTWTASRERFNVDLKQPGSEAQSDKWQKLYYRGLAPAGTQAATESHRTRLRLQPFKAPRR